MPKNKIGGKGHRRGKNSTGDGTARALLLKEPGQEYAKVLKLYGSCRLDALCQSSEGKNEIVMKNRICHIRGKMRKRVWINRGDLILIGVRDFQDDKADVIHKYDHDEAKRLLKRGEIVPSMLSEDNDKTMGETDDIVFETLEDHDTVSDDNSSLTESNYPNLNFQRNRNQIQDSDSDLDIDDI